MAADRTAVRFERLFGERFQRTPCAARCIDRERTRLANLQWQLCRLPPARRTGYSGSVSKPGGLARCSRRSFRIDALGTQRSTAQSDACGPLCCEDAAVRVDEGAGCVGAVHLPAVEFRQHGAGRRPRRGPAGARTMNRPPAPSPIAMPLTSQARLECRPLQLKYFHV